jgi:EAL domain-containing protein (putative c-di-GMP-specific phosphodiesterase class I)
LPQEEADIGIVRLIVELAHTLGLKVTAEGVVNERRQEAW